MIRTPGEINHSGTPNSIPTSTNSSSSSLRIAGLPTPHTPHTPHPHSAIPVITSRFNFGDNSSNNGTFLPTDNLHVTSQGPLNLSTASVGVMPSSLLSPAPSHPSTCSLNSSREELEGENLSNDYHNAGGGGGCYQQQSSPYLSSPHHNTHFSSSPMSTTPQQLYSPGCAVSSTNGSNTSSNNICNNIDMAESISSGNSLLTNSSIENNDYCNTNNSSGPNMVWSILMAGVRVHFVLNGGQITTARLSDELGNLEETHHQRYAPHGLHLLKILYHYNQDPSPHPPPPGQHFYCHLYFRPLMVQQEDIMVVVSPEHPFFVLKKGLYYILFLIIIYICNKKW